MYIPPNVTTVFVGATLLFGSIGLAIAIVWLLKKQRTAAAEKVSDQAANNVGRALQQSKERALSRSEAKGRPITRDLKRVFPVAPEQLEEAHRTVHEKEDEETADEAEHTERDEEGERADDRASERTQDRKPAPTDAPDFITSADTDYAPYLEPTDKSTAAAILKSGGVVYGLLRTENKLMRLDDPAAIGVTVREEGLRALKLPAPTEAPEHISTDQVAFQPYLEKIDYGRAATLLELGAPVYGEMVSGDEVMRVRSITQIDDGTVDREGLYVLNLPMREPLDVNQLQEIPNYLSEEDERFEPYIESVSDDEAKAAFEAGGLVYRMMPSGDELSRVRGSAFPAAKTDDFFVLKLPPLKETAPKTFTGLVLEHGRAPYRFDKANSPSYYVKLDTGGRAPRVVWGADLERAIADGSVNVGDSAKLVNRGFRWVDVEQPVRVPGKGITGSEWKTVKRNTWEAATISRTTSPLPGNTATNAQFRAR